MRNLFRLRHFFALAVIGLSACDYDGYEPNDPGRLVTRTVDEDATIPSINVAGTQLHAETIGDPLNPILLVVHDGQGPRRVPAARQHTRAAAEFRQ